MHCRQKNSKNALACLLDSRAPASSLPSFFNLLWFFFIAAYVPMCLFGMLLVPYLETGSLPWALPRPTASCNVDAALWTAVP